MPSAVTSGAAATRPRRAGSTPQARLLKGVRDFFTVDDPWERPGGGVTRRDVVLAAAVLVLSLTMLEMVRALGGFEGVRAPVWAQWLAVTSGSALLLVRRRWPLTVAFVAGVHMFVTGVTMAPVMGQLSLQVIYFIAFFSGVAWARDRAAMPVVIGGIVTLLFLWVAWQFAVGNGVRQILADVDGATGPEWLTIAVAVALTFVINIIYFGGAVIGGQVAWRSARQRARLEEQAATITGQADDLRRSAVVEERLRIARELHDVVAHHVSVIGIQAAAGRRVLRRDPEAAARALGQVEQSSREAVTQMRGLLGTLRDAVPPSLAASAHVVARAPNMRTQPSGASTASAHVVTGAPDVRTQGEGSEGEADEGRTPEPGLADLSDLVGEVRSPGLTTAYDLVEHPDGAATRLPAPLALSIYRTVQEALTNVARHSTASRATVVVRVDETGPGYAEVEVLDDGRPRRGTSGSGLGQLGIRERAASHRGDVDLGPRTVGGYRVRVRYPLDHVTEANP